MSLYALEALDDALATTRAFLVPADRTTWAKLAFVALFVGGSGPGVFSTSFGGNGGPRPGPAPGGPPGVSLGPRAWLAVAAVVVSVAVVALLFVLVGAVMEFVFVESLRNESVTVRRYWGRRWRQGVRLFVFRLLLGLFLLGGVALVAVPFLVPVLGFGAFGSGLPVAVFLALVPLFLLLVAVVALVNSFTTVFVVPVMLLEDCGVVAGWRRLWPTLVGQWKQYLAYAVAAFFLSILGSVAVGIATLLGVVVLLVPFGLLFALAFGLFALVSQPLGVVALVVVGVAFALAVVAVAAVVQVPVKTYLRYYALLVLGDVDPDLDLIPDQRAAARTAREADEQ
jgi:hypothetical protein